ncbi:glutamate racemase [Vermiculatibacterium agrestimuris]|uniref:glutamate racemase n=1 Tax=Vermiculatibacterium agrestimuris TaxID=2941519 RepID=UPI00203A3B3F|nr:glutamate racemase [Vermiculatibacterium agrestimuris]
MDPRPIGVFDSGLGGLTALRELRRLLPGEELIYFGDTGRVPYGGRSREIILRYARQDVAFLRSFDPKAIIIACGTVSANALTELSAENDLPIFGVVGPAAQAAAATTRNGKVGLIGTAASIRSGAYEREIAQLAPRLEVFSRPCPLFVPLVENGRFRPGDQVVELVAEEYLQPLRSAGVDTLVLGCTHYPLLRDVVGQVMGPQVTLIDTGAVCAVHAARALEAQGLLARRETGQRRYFVSDSTQDFARLAGIFLGEDVEGSVERIEIEKY